MNGWQVQRSGAHTALCTLKYLRTSKRKNCVTCVTIAYKTHDKTRGYVMRSKQMDYFEKQRPLDYEKGDKETTGRKSNKQVQTNGWKGRQTGRQTDRQTDGQKDSRRTDGRSDGWMDRYKMNTRTLAQTSYVSASILGYGHVPSVKNTSSIAMSP